MKLVILWSDALIFLLVASLVAFFWVLRRDPETSERWDQVFNTRLGMASFVVILTYVGIALIDSIHFRKALEPERLPSPCVEPLQNGIQRLFTQIWFMYCPQSHHFRLFRFRLPSAIA